MHAGGDVSVHGVEVKTSEKGVKDLFKGMWEMTLIQPA